MDIPDKVMQWKFGNAAGNLQSTAKYVNDKGLSLYSVVHKQYLNWHKETLGINLGFTGQTQTKWHLHVPDGKKRDILCGEPIALANGGGDPYLNYHHRTVGINLDWAAKGDPQWRIFAKGVEVGKPIPIGATCAIHNEKVEPDPDFLVHFERPGGDIGWTTSPHWYDGLTAAAKTAIKAAAIKAATALIAG